MAPVTPSRQRPLQETVTSLVGVLPEALVGRLVVERQDSGIPSQRPAVREARERSHLGKDSIGGDLADTRDRHDDSGALVFLEIELYGAFKSSDVQIEVIDDGKLPGQFSAG